MPARRVSSYRLHKATGQAIVKLGGKTHYLGKHGSKASQVKYAQKIAEWSARDGEPPPPALDEVTILELLDRFRQYAATYYVKDGRPTGEAANFDHAMRPLLLLYGSELVKDFGPRKLKTVRDLMVKGFTDRNGKKMRDCSRKVVNRQVSRLKRIFRWAVEEELAPGDLAHALGAVEALKRGRSECRETEPVGPVDSKHVEATLPHLPEVVADMVRVHRLTACRPGEVCSMRPKDIDRSVDPWEYRPESHKPEVDLYQ